MDAIISDTETVGDLLGPWPWSWRFAFQFALPMNCDQPPTFFQLSPEIAFVKRDGHYFANALDFCHGLSRANVDLHLKSQPAESIESYSILSRWWLTSSFASGTIASEFGHCGCLARAKGWRAA